MTDDNNDFKLEGLSEAVNEIADEQEKKVILNIAWEPGGEDELAASIFRHSPETVKKGEPYDLLVLFCAFFAFACSFIMLISGINNGFTPSMIFLLVCYVLIIFCCLCKPLHYALSKLVWKTGFKDRFPVNHGCADTICLSDTALEYKDVSGATVEVPYNEMSGIYETENYIVFHENDKSVFAVNKRQIDSDELRKKVYGLIEEHSDPGVEMKSADEIEREFELGDEDFTKLAVKKTVKKSEGPVDRLELPEKEKIKAPEDIV